MVLTLKGKRACLSLWYLRQKTKYLVRESFFTLLHLIKHCETLNILADFLIISVSLSSLPIIFYVEVPGGSESKASACTAGNPGFNPWVRKIPWRRKRQPTLVLLPGSHGGRSLTSYSPWGSKELDRTERLHFHFLLFSSFYLFLILIFFHLFLLVGG